MKQVVLQSSHSSDTSVTPSKVICLGRNYADHAKELNNPVPSAPVIFMKPNSSISQTLLLPNDQHSVHYETELCFMVKEQQLFAIGIGLDLTKRDLQHQLKTQGLPWEQAKGFDGAAVLSHFIPLHQCLAQNIEQHTFRITLHLNQQLLQDGDSHQMLTQPLEFLRAAQSFMTLEDGDILMTGTPKGVGPIASGDHLCARLYCDEQLLIEKNWEAQSAAS